MSIKKILFFRMTAPVSFTAIFVLLFFVWGWVSSSLILKVPRLAIETSPTEFNLDFENVSFQTPDKIKICGWFVKTDTTNKSNKTIIICHGWGTNRADILSSTIYLLKHNFNLLYFDFRGHGESGGNISSLGKLESIDLISAIDFLKKEKPLCSQKIGTYGVSMGASVAILSAAIDKRIEAVVVDSPFSSFNYIVARYAKLFYKVPKYPLLPVTYLFAILRLGFNPENYSTVNYVSKISPKPIFFIHGESDVRIPFMESKKLYELAGNPKQFWSVPHADHVESYTMKATEYEKRVSEFFGKYLK